MIVPDAPQHVAAVADHYDELDAVYRELWGEHVHHGLWTTGREDPVAAVEALVDAVGDRLRLVPGEACVDIGCGYGATARRLAATRGVRVTGLTLSAEQARYAADHPAEGVEVLVRDWLDNGLPDAWADAAWAIESSEHMLDKPGFFAEAHRVLSPGGRLVVCAWLADPDARDWQVRPLLEPICREGRLPSMGTREEYAAMAEAPASPSSTSRTSAAASRGPGRSARPGSRAPSSSIGSPVVSPARRATASSRCRCRGSSSPTAPARCATASSRSRRRLP